MYLRDTHNTGLGDVEPSIVDRIGTVAQAAAAIARDPALMETVCLVLRLNAVTEGLPPGPPCPERSYTEFEASQGIGLASAVGPLRAVVWAKEHPILAAVGVSVTVFGTLGLFYWLGRTAR